MRTVRRTRERTSGSSGRSVSERQPHSVPIVALAPALRALLDALPMPIVLKTADGDLIYENTARRASKPAACEQFTVSLPGVGACVLVLGALPEPGYAQTQRLASLGFMVTGMCHEVSNPLSAVHSMVQILQSKRGVDPATLEKGLAFIGANIARVLAITRKLGDFSRVGEDTPVPVLVDTAVDEAISLLRHSVSGHEVSVEYRGTAGASVLARLGDLQQVVFNILLNAAQAMNGAGRIEVCAVPIGSDRLELVIRDSGPGIPEVNLARVFEPFFTTKKSGEGTGLGLAISAEIVHEMGGSIRASNHPEGGACFTLDLPLWQG